MAAGCIRQLGYVRALLRRAAMTTVAAASSTSVDGGVMRVELLLSPDCAYAAAARAMLRRCLQIAGLDLSIRPSSSMAST
jgi:hypothetical protein